MDVPEGEPLIGLKSDLYLDEMPRFASAASSEAVIEVGYDGMVTSVAEAECRRLITGLAKPEQWPLRLGLRLLKEHNDRTTPWSAYLNSLAERPASPLLWSAQQANELQYIPVKLALLDQLTELRRFWEESLDGCTELGSDVSLATFARFVALAMAAGREVRPGVWSLLPVVDLVAPPEGPASDRVLWAQPPPKASCTFKIEGGGADSFAIVTAARPLRPGDYLTCDHGLSDDELLLRHGLVTKDMPGAEVVGRVRLPNAEFKNWQMKAIENKASGQPQDNGDLMLEASVRRADKIAGAIDSKLFYTSRVISCRSEKELFGLGEWASDAASSRGLRGLDAKTRSAVLVALTSVVDSFLQTFQTTSTTDSSNLPTMEGNYRIATAFRLEKKRILEDVLDLLGKMALKVNQRSKEKGLPAAVTGRVDKAAPGFSNGIGGLEEAGSDSNVETAGVGEQPVVAEGAVVEVLLGKYTGHEGVVLSGPTSLGMVNLRLKSGMDLKYVAVQNVRLVKAAPRPAQRPVAALSSATATAASAPLAPTAPVRTSPPRSNTVSSSATQGPARSQVLTQARIAPRTPQEAQTALEAARAAPAKAAATAPEPTPEPVIAPSPAPEPDFAPAPAPAPTPTSASEPKPAPAEVVASGGSVPESLGESDGGKRSASRDLSLKARPVRSRWQQTHLEDVVEKAAQPDRERQAQMPVTASAAAPVNVGTVANGVTGETAASSTTATEDADRSALKEAERDRLRRAMRALNLEESLIEKAFRIADELD